MKILLRIPALVFSLAMTIASCKGQVQATSPGDTLVPSPKIMGGTPEELQVFLAAGIDPYFVETTDTVSTRGPRCIVRDLLCDRSGNIWLASWQGIIQYDGNVFTNYTLKEGLLHFHVFSCYEDQEGNLWFGTARGGMYRYDGKTFTLFTEKDGLADNTVLCMGEDKEGNTWFGTDSGASRYDGKTFTNFTIRDGLSGNRISSMIRDKTGKLWLGGDGITIYDGKSFKSFTGKNGVPFKKVVSLFEDKTGNIWIGKFDGLTIYDGETFTDHLTNFITYYFAQDATGNVWFTHSEPNPRYAGLPNQVLCKYDGKTFAKIIEKQEPGDCQLFGKAADHSGNIWFGTMKGLCRYDGKNFTLFSE